ncbi:MAG: ABC transporter permease [Veillonellaceae bacterium]|nr:ABC transporter permease [Veillonellaceae bacterium]
MRLPDIWRLEWHDYTRRGSALLWLLIALPLAFTLFFGGVYMNNALAHLPLTVYDADGTATSRQLVEAFATADRFELVEVAAGPDQFQDALREGRAYVGVYIPPHLTRDVKQGHRPAIGVVVNSANLSIGNSALAAAKEIALTGNVRATQLLTEALDQPTEEALRTAYPVRLGIRLLNNPVNGYSYFMLLGLVANGMQIAIYLVAATLLSREYRRLERWRDARSSAIVFVKSVLVWLLATPAFWACILLCHLLFGIPLRSSATEWLALSAAFTFLFCELCLFFSALFPNAVLAIQLPMVFIMPGLLFSGLSWPLEWFPAFPAAYAKVIPLRYLVVSLRELSLRGYAINYTSDLLTMLIAGAVLAVACLFVFHWQRKRYSHGEVRL